MDRYVRAFRGAARPVSESNRPSACWNPRPYISTVGIAISQFSAYSEVLRCTCVTKRYVNKITRIYIDLLLFTRFLSKFEAYALFDGVLFPTAWQCAGGGVKKCDLGTWQWWILLCPPFGDVTVSWWQLLWCSYPSVHLCYSQYQVCVHNLKFLYLSKTAVVCLFALLAEYKHVEVPVNQSWGLMTWCRPIG